MNCQQEQAHENVNNIKNETRILYLFLLCFTVIIVFVAENVFMFVTRNECT